KIEAQIYKGFTLRLFMEFQAVGNVIALFQIFFFQNIPSRVSTRFSKGGDSKFTSETTGNAEPLTAPGIRT
ncbi:MAG: hypothetical protein AAF827_12570, partial [Cyanobacteria bacterium P01_D01_bin.6]